jgi:ribonuclease HI
MPRDIEKRKVWVKNYIRKNRVVRNAKNKAWREANPEKELARKQRYRKNNPDIMAVLYSLRRARKIGAKITLTPDETQALRSLQRKRKILYEKTGIKYQLDHILPLSYGGIHHPCNIQIITASKNSIKNNKILSKALCLVSQHYSLYLERVGSRRAKRFKRQLAEAIGMDKVELLLKRK